MLKKPECGWSKLEANVLDYSLIPLLGTTSPEETKIEWSFSYLSNTPVDVLETILAFYKSNRTQICQFDLEEDGVASMIISNHEITFINTSHENPTVYRVLGEDCVEKLIDEMLDDITKNIDDWKSFWCGLETEKDFKENQKNIYELVNEIKKLRKDDGKELSFWYYPNRIIKRKDGIMKIICLIGPSGCGKTTIGMKLKERGILEIVSHTTREMRINEIDGETYYFVDEAAFEKLDKIENVQYAGNRYCISKEEIKKKAEESDMLFAIVTYEGYEALKRCYGNSVISVFIKADKLTCIKRMYVRGDMKESIKNRIKNYSDIDEFNYENECDYIFNNTQSMTSIDKNIDKMLDIIKRDY